VLAVALLAGACGGGDDDEATGRATSVAGVPDGAAYVDQDGLKFNPSSLTVSGGESVFFKNSETTVHTVTINGKNESGTMKADQVFEWTPPGPGEYKITCEFHPQMKATLTVQ
jgi:plastocyanin